MASPQRLLFVCSRNQRRSVTAESLFRGSMAYDVRSGGTEQGTRIRVKQEDIEWADVIFVMEPLHIQRLQAEFKASLPGKRLICLEIPDRYGSMTTELLATLRKRLSLYIEVPALQPHRPEAVQPKQAPPA